MGILIPRSEWGAQYSNGEPGVILSEKWNDVWIHHSDTVAPSEDASREQEHVHMRLLESIGQQRFQQGISYTALVFPSGRAYEGHSINRRGTHTYQRNDSSRAICFVGKYNINHPSDAALVTAAEIVREWSTAGHCPAEISGGHRDVFATGCPGDHLYHQIGYMNQMIVEGTMPSAEDVAKAVWNYPLTNPQSKEVATAEVYLTLANLFAQNVGSPKGQEAFFNKLLDMRIEHPYETEVIEGSKRHKSYRLRDYVAYDNANGWVIKAFVEALAKAAGITVKTPW